MVNRDVFPQDPYKLYINGEFVPSETGETFSMINPATGEVFATAYKGGLADVEKAILAAPSLITKAPIENAKTLATMPKKFYKEYLKGNKAIGALATASGIVVLAFNTLKGKVIANKKNADVDHYTNTGHIKTK